MTEETLKALPFSLDDIDEVLVHPAIGIARVGNSEHYFIGPEAPGPFELPEGGTKRNGMIQRQAARFRVFAKLEDGRYFELTADFARIAWTVEIANLKAGWYQFNNAMDLQPSNLVIPSGRRNAQVAGAARAALDICPTPLGIEGRDVSGPAYQFRNGLWHGQPVYLGELRTDDAGRLVFLGGLGTSKPQVPGTRPTTFANNDGWHDDTSDGPVRARVQIGAWSKEATPGFVVTAPPNYAPGIAPIVTMYDTVLDMFIARGDLAAAARPSFTTHIWPIFERITGHQWVNHGFYLLAGHGSPLDARDPTVIARLNDASAANADFRDRIFRLFREPGNLAPHPEKLPPIYGDTFGDSNDLGLAQLSLTPTMHAALRQWAQGDFAADWTGMPTFPDIDAIPVDLRPSALDRAALEGIIGGPFHPGIELTWIMRQPRLWARPFRLAALAPGAAVRQDYGATLTSDVCLGPGGPCDGAGPGSLTRWLGLPWQTDEASCDSARAYNPSHFLTVPSFWGARVPNEVLSRENFDFAHRKPNAPGQGYSPTQRLKHFSRRDNWLRDIQGRGYPDRIANMVTEWWSIGIVEPHDTKGLGLASGLPEVVHVETGRAQDYAGTDPTRELAGTVADAFDPPPPSPAGPSAAAALAPRVPAKRSYRRGEV